MRADVKVEDIHRQSNRRARIGEVHNPSNMPLDGRAREQEVDLIIIVSYSALVTCLSLLTPLI